MAEIREIVERFRDCDRGRLDEVLALLPLLQGQLDPTSFVAGMLFGGGGGGGGFDATAALLMMATANANSSTQGTGGAMPSSSMNTILPLLLLLRPDRDRRSEIEIIDKPAAAKR